MAKKKTNVRKAPRLSANALAGYMTATAARRESILREQKFPAAFRARWYDVATQTITRCLVHPSRDAEIVVQRVDRILGDLPKEKHDRQVATNNAAALQSFASLLPDIDFDTLVASRSPNTRANISIEGVALSVRPEIALSGRYRGEQLRGGVRLYMSKTTKLGEDGGAIIGALLHAYSTEACGKNQACKQRHCQVIDVFGEEIYLAPTAIKRRMRDIEAACREIRERWPSIQQ